MFDDPIRRLLRDLMLLERDLFLNLEREPMLREVRFPRLGNYNIRETESEYIITIPLPGVRKEDINLYLVDNKLVLEVNSQRRAEKKDKNEEFISVGVINIRQEIPLPINADKNSIKAEYRNGLLVIRIKKLSSGFGKRIPIE